MSAGAAVAAVVSAGALVGVAGAALASGHSDGVSINQLVCSAEASGAGGWVEVAEGAGGNG